MLTSVRYKNAESIKKKKSSIEEDNDKEIPSLAQSRNKTNSLEHEIGLMPNGKSIKINTQHNIRFNHDLSKQLNMSSSKGLKGVGSKTMK
jgi:hypothetical protein